MQFLFRSVKGSITAMINHIFKRLCLLPVRERMEIWFERLSYKRQFENDARVAEQIKRNEWRVMYYRESRQTPLQRINEQLVKPTNCTSLVCVSNFSWVSRDPVQNVYRGGFERVRTQRGWGGHWPRASHQHSADQSQSVFAQSLVSLSFFFAFVDSSRKERASESCNHNKTTSGENS